MNRTDKTFVLLLEDDPDDAMIVQEILQEDIDKQFEVTHSERLEDGIKLLEDKEFDVVLLDLTLSDSIGLNTLAQLHDKYPRTPIVVLTGLDIEEVAVGAMHKGAQDYLVKGEFDGKLLGRSIRYAIERQRLISELEDNWQRELQKYERELQSLQDLSKAPKTKITTQIYSTGPLNESEPNVFDSLVKRYCAVLGKAVEQRTYKVDYDISEELQDISEELGFLRAGPRDVVKLHSRCLKEKTEDTVTGMSQVYLEEGRFLVLELMGYMVSYYRNYSVGSATVGLRDKEKKDNTQG